jgi:hypothetical protein
LNQIADEIFNAARTAKTENVSKLMQTQFPEIKNSENRKGRRTVAGAEILTKKA